MNRRGFLCLLAGAPFIPVPTGPIQRSRIFIKLPLENLVVAALILEPGYFNAVAARLSPEMLQVPECRRIFEWMKEQHERLGPLGFSDLMVRFQDAYPGMPTDVPGIPADMEDVVCLLKRIPHPKSVVDFADVLRRFNGSGT